MNTHMSNGRSHRTKKAIICGDEILPQSVQSPRFSDQGRANERETFKWIYNLIPLGFCSVGKSWAADSRLSFFHAGHPSGVALIKPRCFFFKQRIDFFPYCFPNIYFSNCGTLSSLRKISQLESENLEKPAVTFFILRFLFAHPLQLPL